MTGPPAARGAVTQEPAAAGVAREAKTTLKLSSRVKIVNPVSNDRGFIRRRDAEFFIAQGRAIHVGKVADRDHIRLIEAHPQNKAAARLAARDDRQSFEENRGSFVFWNGGTAPSGTHRPGDVLS
jgi:hypothetical protein